jgi:hypothetical protein
MRRTVLLPFGEIIIRITPAGAEAWSVVRVEFRRALALRSQIRRAGWFN